MAATEDRTARATTLAAALARSIERGILDERLGPGRLGTKEELQRLYGVAPATLNETLRILQARGLVDVRRGPRGGVFAVPPSPLTRLGHTLLRLGDEPAAAADCLRVRDALEPLVVADAVGRCTPDDAAALKVIVAEMTAAANDTEAFFRTNWALHRRIAELSPNTLLRSYYGSLLEFAENELRLAVPERLEDEVRDELLRVHRELVGGIVRRDPAAAARALADHAALTGALVAQDVERTAAKRTRF